MPRPGPPPLPTPEIDREKICPLLLRVFPKLNAHHTLEDFGKRGQQPADEVKVYTWPDASLRELAELVQEINQHARSPNARLSFSFVYPDKRGKNVMRHVGTVHSRAKGEDDLKSLASLNFQTGDFLDVAIML